MEMGERLPHEVQPRLASIRVRLNLSGIEDETWNHLSGKPESFVKAGIVLKSKVSPENKQ